MGEIKWTDDQEKAIVSSGKNILVSAAAGSGKTAVLVERVVRQVIRKDNPVDIGSFVIMTFTRAAAAQMRDKLYKAIRQAIKNDPDNENLRSQLHRVHIARICTIDALCMDIVKENFQATDTDPGFRLADESEIKMLKADVLSEVIESAYEDGDEGFLQFVDFYMDRNDAKIESIILRLFDFAQSHPDPEGWINDCRIPYENAASFEVSCTEEQNQWLEKMGELAGDELAEIGRQSQIGIKICQLSGGPYPYEPYFEKIREFIDDITGADRIYDYRRDAIGVFIDGWEKSPRCPKDVESNLKDVALKLRKGLKEKLADIRKKYFREPLEIMFADMDKCKISARQIVDLTIKFSKSFAAAKKEKNIVDFNDISHMALSILSNESLGIGDRMAREISEIIVDEYQDTNELQDAIIRQISAERFGRPNVFMVGDVKQSIYGFRMACPDLFNEKYDSYPEEKDNESTNQLIKLNANFRSRAEVTGFVNYVFNQTMIKKVGGTEYKNGHELYPGASYPEPEGNEFLPEVIMVNNNVKNSRLAKKAEAFKIARRIQELVETGHVSENGCFRKINYSDIAILTRNSSNIELEKALESAGIPALRSSNSGFFSSFEIKLALNLLKVIDNPNQDIPLAAVITSPIVGITGNELARIKISHNKRPFVLYEACRNNSEISKLKSFMEKLEYYRKCSEHMSVIDLFDMVVENSGLVNCILAMPGGEARKANLNFLKNQITAFSNISYSGLFNFLRYIDNMQKNGMDFGQAPNPEENLCAVKIMTIHKSKGLEFPVVFIAGCGKEYNESDLRSNIVMDRRYGLGLEKRDSESRLVTSTMLMETIKAEKKKETFAEEMRLLYVAMTRAKEKLIITGVVSGIDRLAENWCSKIYNSEQSISTTDILSFNTYMKVVGCAIATNPASGCIYKLAGIDDSDIREQGSHLFSVELIDVTETEEKRVSEVLDAAAFKKSVEKIIEENNEDPGNIFTWKYPFAEATKMQVKFSASQLENHEDWAERLFLPKTSGLSGAERGNAYHRFFELLDYEKSDIEEMLGELVNKKLMKREEADAIEINKIKGFLNSNIGKRMKKAAEKGKLIREQQFVMGIEENGEKRLLQGIMDAFFEEDGEIVLVDYKTDRNRTADELIHTYQEQLKAYSMVLKAALEKNVKAMYIYSVELEEAIEVKGEMI